MDFALFCATSNRPMQSSSTLFPVALLSAERRGDLSEDVYRIKAGFGPDPSVALAVTRLGLADQNTVQGIPVILLHGSFSNRRFWYSPKGGGLGAYLARAGFDVWIPEMRGHGLSPRNRDWAQNTVAAYARDDVPAIGAFVHEKAGRAPLWVGHSLGGTTLAVALGSGALAAQHVAGVALFGSQVSRSYWPLKVPPVVWGMRWLLRRWGQLSGARFGRGPEDEPVGLALEHMRWHGLFGRFGDKQGDWWAGLAQVDVPTLAVAATGDQQSPPWACRTLFEQFGGARKQLLCLGPAAGFDAFGHTDMLASQAAHVQVWPLVERWLREPGLPVHASVEAAALVPAL
ncbi:alpha/beta fold hydrolase [Pseudomonas putida]|nr:alpha/beta fold hydrolase [Pseudomonas putida]